MSSHCGSIKFQSSNLFISIPFNSLSRQIYSTQLNGKLVLRLLPFSCSVAVFCASLWRPIAAMASRRRNLLISSITLQHNYVVADNSRRVGISRDTGRRLWPHVVC